MREYDLEAVENKKVKLVGICGTEIGWSEDYCRVYKLIVDTDDIPEDVQAMLYATASTILTEDGYETALYLSDRDGKPLWPKPLTEAVITKDGFGDEEAFAKLKIEVLHD